MIPFIYAANWKMNKTPDETKSFFSDLVLKNVKLKDNEKAIFFVPALNMQVTKETLAGSHYEFGGQNCYFETNGAFTGENSPKVLSQMGASSCLVGHSERRSIFNESSELLSKKMKVIFEENMTPVLCVGEALSQRQENKTKDVIIGQLKEALADSKGKTNFILAYEPVWAIGTGVVAEVEQVAQAHQWLRGELSEMNLEKTPILYGGSVKPESAEALKQVANVNGFLIGGASLKVDSFVKIIEA